MRSATGLYAFFILLAGHAGSASAWPQRFDLVCVTRGHVAADPHPRSRGTYPANVRRWRNHSRLIVDLRAMRYCVEPRCVVWGASRIAAVNSHRILLAYIARPNSRSNAVTETVRSSDGFYRYWQMAADGYTVLETGSCRRQRFSGFPAGTRPTEELGL